MKPDGPDRRKLFADGGARQLPLDAGPEPVFRDRNGLAAAATYQAVLDAERNPEVFSNTGGSGRTNRRCPMIDMDDLQHLLRRKLVNAGFTRKQVMDKAAGIATLCDTLIDAVCERGSATSSAISPPRCRWPSSVTCSVSCRPTGRRC